MSNIITRKDGITKMRNKSFMAIVALSIPGNTVFPIMYSLGSYLRNNSTQTSIKSCKQLLEGLGVNPSTPVYKQAFTALKKAGLILKHKGYYHIHPALDNSFESQDYLGYIEYYSLLYKDTDFLKHTEKELEDKAIDMFMNKEVYDFAKNLSIDIEEAKKLNELAKLDMPTVDHELSYENLYRIAFDVKKNISENLTKVEQGMRAKIINNLRNLSVSDYGKYLATHLEILEKMGFVELHYNKGYLHNISYVSRTHNEVKNMPFYSDIDLFAEAIYKAPEPPEYGTAQWYSQASTQERAKWVMEDPVNNGLLAQEFDKRDGTDYISTTLNTPSKDAVEPFSYEWYVQSNDAVRASFKASNPSKAATYDFYITLDNQEELVNA